MFRACRLVVDTGIHSMGWRREIAVQYMLDNNNYNEDMIRSIYLSSYLSIYIPSYLSIYYQSIYVRGEVKRYITMPGQATSYKVGQIKILQFREKAKKALGERFDLKAFHEVTYCIELYCTALYCTLYTDFQRTIFKMTARLDAFILIFYF